MGKNKLVKHQSLPIVFNPFSRRLFIQSSLGYIAIPMIASLLPRKAWAAVDNENAYRKAVFLVNRHGGHWLDAHPKGINYTNQNGVNIGNLTYNSLGPIYNNSYRDLYNKISVLTGLDCAGACGHVFASALAASFSQDRTLSSGQVDLNEVSSENPDSIDVLIARKIYSTNHPVKVLRINGRHCFAGGRAQTGVSNDAAYDLIMNNLVVSTQTASIDTSVKTAAVNDPVENQKRRYILEKALNSLSLTKKSRNVSQTAASQISEYQEILAQARDSYNATQTDTGGGTTTPDPVVVTQTCENLRKPSSGDTQTNLKASADLIVAALKCGVTRLAYMDLPHEHYYVHRVSDAANRDTHKVYLRDTALAIGGYLMKAMDSIKEANGNSLLENSAVLITSDLASSKFDNHNGVNMRVMIGGGLNGKLQMGKAVDYQGNSLIVAQNKNSLEENLYGGRPYNEVLISIMRGFGLTQADYGSGGRSGYGHYHYQEVAHSQLLYDIHLAGDKTQMALQNYYKNTFLKNYNKDSTLPGYYLG